MLKRINFMLEGDNLVADKKLNYAELVRNNADIEDFYRKYCVENT